MYRKIIIGLIPWLLVLVYFSFIYKQPLELNTYVYNDTPIILDTYDDAHESGSSKITITTKDGITNMDYVLAGDILYPYVGVMYRRKDSSYFDLSRYDKCSITLKAKEGKILPFYLYTYVKDHSNRVKLSSYHYLQYKIQATSQWKTHVIELDNYITPSWWLAENGFTDRNFEQPDFSKTVVVSIANCDILKKNIDDTIEIQSIRFIVDYNRFLLFSSVFTLLFYITFISRWFVRKYFFKTKITEDEKPHETVFTYEKIETTNFADKEEESIFSFINSHYQNPELTVIDVQNETGVGERKIAHIIKSKTDLNFKQFLNKLRISEAKRLLVETDLQISDIAFKTGYNNISHFNRVFKNLENISPGDFRKQ